MPSSVKSWIAFGVAQLTAALIAGGQAHAAPRVCLPVQDCRRFIVESRTTAEARIRVEHVGAWPERNLEIIHAVVAPLNPWQRSRLSADAHIRIYEDRSLNSSAKPKSSTTTAAVTAAAPTPGNINIVATESLATSLVDGDAVSTPLSEYQTDYTLQTGATMLQFGGITGRGITIAVLDTGLWIDPQQNLSSRILATANVTNGSSGPVTGDLYGHGTHVTSIMAGGAQNVAGGYFGVAPQANLVIVQAFDGFGAGRYADVIAGLDWIVANAKKYNIRVVNLSFGAPPQSDYWDDPVNQAVMAAWQAGIVVVAAAGNEGPAPMSIDVPGNVPYVITVGALTDNYTPYNTSDDRLASFSSAGPTFEGFVKPEVIAPGGHVVGSMQSSTYLANIDPDSMSTTESLFVMSGSSQAAAVTSGVVALILQADPALSPDQVKCKLMASASPAVTAGGTLAYSVFQQGAGLINAISAVNSPATGCANVGLNIGADLAGTTHFGGPANQNSSGAYYIMNMGSSTWGSPLAGDGFTWSTGFPYGAGYNWSAGYVWANGYTWSKGYTWSRSAAWAAGYTWSTGYTWSRSLPWWGTTGAASSAAAPASIENWTANQ
jgi:serine protease AprX